MGEWYITDPGVLRIYVDVLCRTVNLAQSRQGAKNALSAKKCYPQISANGSFVLQL
jgi:hypothetical protein